MKKKRRGGRKSRFTDEQKALAIAMCDRGDLTVKQVAASVGVSTKTLSIWRRQLKSAKETTPLTIAERRRLAELERLVKELTLQLEIQKKFRTFSRKHRP
jgi:transposase-like protein